MASLTNLSTGTFNSLFLVNDQNQVENIRDVFGAAQSSVPTTPQPTDVLNVTGLTTLLAEKRAINDSYDRNYIDSALALCRLITDSFSQTEINNLVSQRRLISDSYSQSQVSTKT